MYKSPKMTKKLFLSFAISLHYLTLVLCKNCVQIDQCKCAFDDGSGTIDISPIGKQDGTPLINNEFAPDNYAYSYNPCYPFSLGTCTNCAACQYDATNVVYYNIGDAKKVQFSYDGTNVVATYTADDGARFVRPDQSDGSQSRCFHESSLLRTVQSVGSLIYRATYTRNNTNLFWATCFTGVVSAVRPFNYVFNNKPNFYLSYDGLYVIGKYVFDDSNRTSIVTFVCDPSAEPATYSVDGETATATYGFTITSKYACVSVTTTPTTHMTTSPPTSIDPNTKPSCKRKTDCSCLFNDGTGEMDLSGLGRTDGTPLINNVFAPDGFGYSFNPCYAFNLETCSNAAVCRFDSASKTYKNIGSSSGVEYLYDGNNVVGTYTSSDGKTKTMVTFICDLHELIPFYDVIGEVTTGTYISNITIKTNRVCPSICGAKPGWNLVG